MDKESPLTQEGIDAMKDKKFIEQVLRMNPDVIYTIEVFFDTIAALCYSILEVKVIVFILVNVVEYLRR